jgi:hypothetical protein
MRNGLYAAVITFFSCALLLVASNSFSQGIGNLQTAGNRHNLSVTGTGAIKSLTENRICVFCHTPHMAYPGTPLWNHTMSVASYTVSNPPGVTGTQLSTPQNPPDGDSKLCLSCHDGTVPIGAVQNIDGHPGTVSVSGTLPAVGNGSTNLGTNLSGHHLVSIEYNQTLKDAKDLQCPSIGYSLLSPSGTAAAYLRPTSNSYAGGATQKGVQCTSCHDPHYDPIPGTTTFLRGAAGAPTPQPTYPSPTQWVYADNLCLACHCLCGSCP